ncbi:unnamed protein product, partial [Hapterophycus canaliculatus]
GPHKDGPLYEGRVAILSLGKEAFLDFWGSLEDAEADCAAIVAEADGCPATGTVTAGTGCPDSLQERQAATRALASVRCEDGSLVMFKGQAYHDAWHGIASTAGTGSGAAVTALAASTISAEPDADADAVACSESSSRTSDDHAAGGAARTDAADAISTGAAGGSDIRGEVKGVSQKRLSFTIRRVARVLAADSVMEHSEARSEMERRRRGFEHSVTDTG